MTDPVDSPAPRTPERLPADDPDRCQTWGYYSGLRCVYRQAHKGAHLLDRLVEPVTHEYGVGKPAEGEAAAAPPEPPRPLYNASGTTANADLPRADSATAQPPLDVERLTGIIEDIPPHIIKAAAGDSAEGLAAMIVARLAASSEHPEPTGETPQP